MSSKRLQRLSVAMQEYIDKGRLPGIVTMISRNGKVVHFEAQGERYTEERLPMTKDTIFFIASMTKPITSVALMTLYEEGKFLLDVQSKLSVLAMQAIIERGSGRASTIEGYQLIR